MFVEGQSAKALQSNFRGPTFQNCSTHSTHLAAPFNCSGSAWVRFEPVEDLWKQLASKPTSRPSQDLGGAGDREMAQE